MAPTLSFNFVVHYSAPTPNTRANSYLRARASAQHVNLPMPARTRKVSNHSFVGQLRRAKASFGAQVCQPGAPKHDFDAPKRGRLPALLGVPAWRTPKLAPMRYDGYLFHIPRDCSKLAVSKSSAANPLVFSFPSYVAEVNHRQKEDM